MKTRFYILFLIVIALLIPNINYAMGMDYYIFPDSETKCKNDFPHGLSQFFERYGGFGDKSEVIQISNLFEIDLSIFQKISSEYDEELIENPVWINLDSILNIIESLLIKVEENPKYYNKLLTNPNYEDHSKKLEESIFNSDISSSETIHI